MAARVVQLDFDTELLGLRCGRLELAAEPPSRLAIDGALADAREQDIQHLVARVPSEWVEVCRQLESRGFRFAVCSLSLRKALPDRAGEEPRASARAAVPPRAASLVSHTTPSGAPETEGVASPTPRRGGVPVQSPDRHVVRSSASEFASSVLLYEGEDDARLAAITDAAFHSGTRFHLEPAFSPTSVTSLHRRWMQNLIDDESVSIWVHRMDDTITGYITLAQGDRPASGHVGLVGVDPAFRRRGIGQGLLAALESEVQPLLDEITVVTESANIAALRLYTRAGYTIRQSWTVFHAMMSASTEVTHAGRECRTADPRT